MGTDHGGRSGKTRVGLRLAPGANHKNFARLLVVFGLALAGLLLLSVSAGAQSESGGLESLDQAVVEEMGVESDFSARSFASVKEEGRTQVNVMRSGEGEDWAFGSAIIEAPKKKGHYPKGWLFVAEDGGAGWDVALEGTPGFSELTSEAPDGVVGEEEKETFSARSTSAAPISTGLRLPWKKNTTWKFTGGPHGWATGYDRPYAALDFAGKNASDQSVRASGPGRAYFMCSGKRGWMRVHHGSGYSTDYYHLSGNVSRANGAFVPTGGILGQTGEDVCGGGAAFGRHVHFAILRNGQHVTTNNKYIGGWRFIQGEAYGGYAQHKAVKRYPSNGTVLRNFGP